MPDARQRFIETYAASFLAAWAANNYEDACRRGVPERLTERAPVEDAESLAVETWNRMVDLRLDITKATD